MPKIMLTTAFANDDYASDEREQGLAHLRTLGELVEEEEGGGWEGMPIVPTARLVVNT